MPVIIKEIKAIKVKKKIWSVVCTYCNSSERCEGSAKAARHFIEVHENFFHKQPYWWA